MTRRNAVILAAAAGVIGGYLAVAAVLLFRLYVLRHGGTLLGSAISV